MVRGLPYHARHSPHLLSLAEAARVVGRPMKEVRREVVKLRLRYANRLSETLDLGEAAWLLTCSRESARALLRNGALGSEPDYDGDGSVLRHRIPRGQVVLLAQEFTEGTAAR